MTGLDRFGVNEYDVGIISDIVKSHRHAESYLGRVTYNSVFDVTTAAGQASVFQVTAPHSL